MILPWVTLIPKFEGTIEITDYRPVNMVGCICKVITKILAKKLKEVVPNLVGEAQTTFISGRNVHDGVLIASKVTH